MCKYSFIMPYYDRKAQLEATMRSFDAFYGDRVDFEIIIVVDNRDTLRGPYKNTKLYGFDNNTMSPVKLYNYGASKASGKYLVITNPECLHETDILGELDALMDEGVYCVARCKYQSGNSWRWKQHPEYAPSLLHFCSCISKANFDKVGGFDDEFADGYCFDDDAFRDAVRLAGIPIKHMDGVVFHQSHKMDWKRNPDKQKLWERNRKLWQTKYADKL